MSATNTNANAHPSSTKEDPRLSVTEFRRFLSLRGQPIWIAEAARKYDIPQPTLNRWKKRGYISEIRRDADDPRKILVDECETAYCAAIYHDRKKRGIKWLFNKDGTPYVKVAARKPTRRKSTK